ncbi:MAG: hypothetical protein OXN96_13265 [Bryobacterales bacterium]|nr:hypothetical protein [Bryobacterales bacterium]MDE0621163.1 hypothetical protein [Bryobacterales bacterium]
MDSDKPNPADGARPLATTLGGAIADIVRHPVHRLIRNWNWKAAVISACLRTTIFFTVNLTASWNSAVSAAVTELFYRAPMVGTLAAMSQSFRRVEPAWVASAVVMAVLPAMGHGIEFIVHWLRGTERLTESVAVSVAFSVATTGLNYLLHRRDVLVVGHGARPFRADIFQVAPQLFDMLLRKPMRLLRGAASGADSTRTKP